MAAGVGEFVQVLKTVESRSVAGAGFAVDF